MRSIQLVIDIGSKFTTICRKDKGFLLKDASLVLIANKRNKIELIERGRAVASYIGRTSPNEQAIYPIREGAIYHERAAVLMYRSFLNQVAGESFFRPKMKAIACVSCGLTYTEKRDIEKVLNQAGVSEVVILESPLAIFAGLKEKTAHCIVDIGASKTEIAVVNKDGIVSGCSLNIGGNTVNQAIMDYLLDERKCRLPVEKVEKIKKQIATLNTTDNIVVNEAVTELGTDVVTSIQIHSYEARNAIEGLFNHINTAIISVLSEIPENVAQEVVTNGIYLCGGTSRISGLVEYMENDINIPVRRSENPEDDVVNGAMYYVKHRQELADLLNVVNLK